MRLVGTAGVLVVASALILIAAPGAYAPTEQLTLALRQGELVGRLQDVASRSGERTPEPEVSVPVPAASSVAPSAEPATTPAQAPAAPAPAPAPEQPAAQQPAAGSAAAAQPQALAAERPAATDEGVALSDEIVALTNAERAAAGLPGFGVSACATDQAAARSALLVAEGRFEHDPLGPILEACGARTVGENLSLGYPTAEAAVRGWMNSSGHRENILRASFTGIGVACTSGPRGWLCAQVFVG